MNLAHVCRLAVPLCFALAAVGCNQGLASGASASNINQTDVCETQDYGVAQDCKAGQKVVFLPRQFGNAQLPVYFAAANCDLRYSVVLTNGAVTCIFMPIKVKAAAPEASAVERSASQP